MKLTDDQKKFFIREGYVILPGFVDECYVQAARSHINSLVSSREEGQTGNKSGKKEPSARFPQHVRRGPEITNMIFKTGLIEIADDLLGEGNATVRDNVGQIAYNEPKEGFVAQGDDIKEKPSKTRWHIDSGHGKYACLGSDFSILMGVIISDGQQVDENRGQFTFFPGTFLSRFCRCLYMSCSSQALPAHMISLCFFSRVPFNHSSCPWRGY